jgi:hypothetical protein
MRADLILIEKPGLRLWVDREQLQLGGIIGQVELVDIVTQSRSPWFHGPYGWVLTRPRALPFRPTRGCRNLFDID